MAARLRLFRLLGCSGNKTGVAPRSLLPLIQYFTAVVGYTFSPLLEYFCACKSRDSKLRYQGLVRFVHH
jgi:hypothetical protein